MKIQFSTPIPIGESNYHIMAEISKEIKRVHSKNVNALGKDEKIDINTDSTELIFSFDGSTYGPASTGSAKISGEVINFELSVPDCNPFRFVAAQMYIKSFQVVKVPHIASY